MVRETVSMDSGLLKLIVFFVISCWLAGISSRSLRVVRSHGFFRFFAWEAILALVLVNSGVWFSDPFSICQIASWVLLLASLILLGQGVYLIRIAGKPGGRRQDSTLLSFERTSSLVTSGVYHYIRHPLYGSLLFLAWGTFLKEVTWYSVCLVVAATVLLIVTAKIDEAECVRYFGTAYEEYMKRTKMFVPYLF
jgi:protein-S-isoprenylcysteine O-methyltransferase Ste14